MVMSATVRVLTSTASLKLSVSSRASKSRVKDVSAGAVVSGTKATALVAFARLMGSTEASIHAMSVVSDAGKLRKVDARDTHKPAGREIGRCEGSSCIHLYVMNVCTRSE
jgi:hypothetical protein